MLAMKPHFKSCLDEAAKFVEKWCSADDATNLDLAEIFAKTLTQRREPADCQLGFLADANLNRCPRWPFSMISSDKIRKYPDLMVMVPGPSS